MSNYTDFISEPISDKIILFEITKGRDLDSPLWIKYSPDVWVYSYYQPARVSDADTYGKGIYGRSLYGEASYATIPASANVDAADIPTLKVEGTTFVKVENLATCQSTELSFYYDLITQNIYVNYAPPLNGLTVNVGTTIGYSNKAVYHNNLYYQPRIKSIPALKIARDKLFSGVTTFQGGTVTLINTDGEFDHLGLDDIYGQVVKLKYGSPSLTYDEYETIYTGYIDGYDLVGLDVVIAIKDERKNFGRNIPIDYYDTVRWPYLAERNIGNVIPVGYGSIYQQKATCVNDEEPAASSYLFKMCDTVYHDIKAIDSVFVEGVGVAFSNVDVTFAGFNLDPSVYDPGNKVTVNYRGAVDDSNDMIENSLDVLEDLFLNYASITYNNYNYNVSEWEAVKATVDNIAVAVDSTNLTLIKVIGDIGHSILGTLELEGDGRFNMKVVDLTKEPVKTIKIDDLIKTPKQINKSSDYISSAKVGYRRNFDEKEYSYFINKDEERSLIGRYRSYKEQTFETLLTNSADASAYSDKVMDIYGGIIPEFTIITKMQNVDINIEDIVDLEIYKFSPGVFGTVRTEIISKTIDYTNNAVTLICRWIENVSEDIDLADLIKWRPGITYGAGGIVSSGDRLWVATQLSEDELPSISSEFWDLFWGIDWKDPFDYYPGNSVMFSNGMYKALALSNGKVPDTEPGYWENIELNNDISGNSSTTNLAVDSTKWDGSNKIISTVEPEPEDGEEGDIWFTIET